MNYQPTRGEQKAIAILKDELSNWGQGLAFVTDNVVYDGQTAVKKARKNYFGIYDQEYDPITGRKKIFIPFTEWTVETVLKNIDIDTKDIEVKARKEDSYKIANIFRYVLRYYLSKIEFGKKLNQLLRNTVIDGTAFVKVWKESGTLKMRVVDRLNMTVDPSAPDLSDTPVIERNLLTLPEFQEYSWDNKEYVEGTKSLDRTGLDAFQMSNQNTQIPYVEVYERYGYMPKFVLTENEEDKDYVYMHIIYSSKGSAYIVHKIEEAEEHPYQEFKFRDLVNRFDGRGVPEMLFQIQAYLNEIINIRLNTARVAQSGLWEVRGNITPQQLKRLFTTGAIKTNNEGDIARIDTGTVDPSSYKDEEQAYLWGQRVTQTQAEDEIAPSQPATNALIEERGASKGYNLVMEGIFLNLKKLFEEKIVPIIRQTLKDGDIVRITGDPQALKEIDKELAKEIVYSRAEMVKEKIGVYPFTSYEEMEGEVQRVADELSKYGEDRFPEMNKKMFDTDFDIELEIGDEQINKGVMVNQLVQAMGILGQLGMPVDGVAREIFDTLGLDAEKLVQKLQPVPMMPGMPTQVQPQGMPMEANINPQPIQ